MTYIKGLKAGIPIGLGYLSVAFTFGIMASSLKFPLWITVLISMTNLTSAGQFAGLPLIASGAPLYEMALVQFVINIRYTLMSLSMTQKLDDSVKVSDRIPMSFFITDEIFALAMSVEESITKKFYYGLSTIPYVGWAVGTLLGAVMGNLLPQSVQSALGIAIYAMFIAIIVPPARKKRSIAIVIVIAAAMSSIFYFMPILKTISSGFVIIICAVTAALIGAIFFPVKEGQ